MYRDSAGNLYGTTYYGGDLNNRNCGPGGCGVVFKLDPTGKESVLYTFLGGTDGGVTYTGVTADSKGNLYGVTADYGANGYGVVYKLAPTGEQTVLYAFTGGADGGNPECVLYRNSAGNLFGAASAGGGPMPACCLKWRHELQRRGSSLVLSRVLLAPALFLRQPLD